MYLIGFIVIPLQRREGPFSLPSSLISKL
uniref:Uncharacterized protein n=1 Tax=Rhizophora mucronata TaxID=61149 RepID=A0A2P2NF44_RHIMU